MIFTKKSKVMAKVCYHRGIGRENSLEAISSAIKTSPFLVEFDVQVWNNTLYLGHPPELGESTLAEALELFKNTRLLPKIDLKLTSESLTEALTLLVAELVTWAPRKALVNVGGETSAVEYMNSERLFMSKVGDNALLNIDLERYGGISRDEMIAHIKSLTRMPFSISPNLSDDLPAAIDIAKVVGIPHIHFWAHHDEQYTIVELYNKMKLCQKSGLKVYFDIKDSNISK